ncbi:MAG: hypothetical protein GY926_20640 [bacterium]|nr:hypothetical protein [bacterium]
MADLPLPPGTTVDDILASPHGLLTGRSPAEVANVLGDMPGWQVETLAQGSHAGQGWVLREYTTAGDPTGRMLRWHPGGGRHGPDPYWRATDYQSNSGIVPG